MLKMMDNKTTHPPSTDIKESDGDYTTLVTAGKRARSETPDESSNEVDKDISDNAKRVRTVSQRDALPSDHPPRYLVIHEVYFSGLDNHAHHQDTHSSSIFPVFSLTTIKQIHQEDGWKCRKILMSTWRVVQISASLLQSATAATRDTTNMVRVSEHW